MTLSETKEMVFPDDEVMIVLASIAIGNVTDGESKTMLHVADETRSCDVEIRPRVVAALEQRAWVEIDEATAKIKLTESGTRAANRWVHKKLKIKVR